MAEVRQRFVKYLNNRTTGVVAMTSQRVVGMIVVAAAFLTVAAISEWMNYG